MSHIVYNLPILISSDFYAPDLLHIDSSKDGTRCLNPLRVYVVHAEEPRQYKNASNREMNVIEAVVADTASCRKMSVYNKASFPFIKTGHSLMLVNFISKPTELVITNDCKVLMIPKIEVSESVKQQGMDMAKQLSGNYNAPTMTIAEVEGKPEGTVFTLRAEVTEVLNCNILSYYRSK